MGVGEGGQNPPQAEYPIWFRLWSVVVFVLVLVEVILFSDSLDSPDGAAWLDGRRPLILVAAGVLALPLLAAAQAKWGKTRVLQNTKVGRLGFGSCPAWLEYAAIGLAAVGFVLYAYAGFRSLRGDDAVHVLMRRAAFLMLMGSSCYFELIPGQSRRDRANAEAAKDQPA